MWSCSGFKDIVSVKSKDVHLMLEILKGVLLKVWLFDVEMFDKTSIFDKVQPPQRHII